MSTEDFERRLLGDERTIEGDKAKLASDTMKEDSFAARLGVQGNDISRSLDQQYGPAGGLQQQGNDMSRQLDAQFGAPSAVSPPMGLGQQGADMQSAMNAQFAAPTAVTPPQRGPMLNFRMSDPQQGAFVTPGTSGATPVPPTAFPSAQAGPAQAPPPGAMISRPSTSLATMAVRPPTGMGGPSLGAIAKADNAAYLGTFDDQKQHTADLTGAQAGKLGGEYQLGMEEAARQRDLIQKQQAEAEHAQQLNSQYLQKTDDLNTALMNGHVDPNRLWKKADTGERIAMVIGGFLGGIVPGVAPLMKTVGLSINQDIEAQKHDYERQSAGIKGRDSIYGHMVRASGDAQLASLQTRSGLLEAAKTQIGAQMKGLDIPEAAARGQLAVDQIDQQQKLLKKQISEHAVVVAQQQAAAAAAARAHAEQMAFDRAYKMDELGMKHGEMDIKRYDAETKRLEASGKSGEKQGDLDKNYTDRILRANVPGQESAIGALKGQLTDSKGNVNTHRRIPGLSPLDDFKAKLLPEPGSVSPWSLATGALGQTANMAVGLNSQERVNRNDWDRAKLVYQVEVTGAGGSDKQMEIIDKAFAGAKTPEEQANAIMEKDRMLQKLKLAAAQGDPEVIRRMEAAGSQPASFRPMGGR